MGTEKQIFDAFKKTSGVNAPYAFLLGTSLIQLRNLNSSKGISSHSIKENIGWAL